jgi:transposase
MMCWAHYLRYFVEAMHANAEKLLNITPAETGRDYCNKLFKIERDLEELLPESHLGKAVTYAFNQRVYMDNYLLDGRCSLSNNAAENSIRPFTIGRKN